MELRDTLKLPAAFRCTVLGFRVWGLATYPRDIAPLHAPRADFRVCRSNVRGQG
jgi:hypothetical protein